MGEFDRPFLGSRGLVEGRVSRRQLRYDFTRIYRDVYVRKGIHVDAQLRAEAALLFGGEDAILAGRSAAVVHGTKWIDDDEPAELIRSGFMKAPPKLLLRGNQLEHNEIDVGRRATTPARTAYDLGRRLPFGDAVAMVDALCNASGLKPGAVQEIADQHIGARGVVQLRRVLDVVDGGAESPQETRTRLCLIDAGLPRPATQIVILDEFGRFVARADLGWPEWKVLVEYDGAQHWTDRRQRSRDIDRIATLEALGWKVIRVSADLLHNRPEVLINRVRAALREAGARC